ncbi:MAG: hypothetical protein PHG47_03390 [Sulfuricella sp.]|nr:hypothetical protein [Sulfuricella sp.]
MPSFILVTKKQSAPEFRGKWVYFGENYLDMCRWEKQLGSAERLSYAQWLPQTFKELSGTFIQWVSDLGKPYGSSLDWWMTRLSGRNPLQTPIFLHICYMDILYKRLLGDLQNECLIVCEDWFLLRMIETNLKNAGYATRRKPFWQFSFVSAELACVLEACARWGYALGYQLFALLVVKLLFRFRAEEASGNNAKKTVIIHTCVDEACFGADGKFHDRYFAGLSEWLEEGGYQVWTIPWLFNLKRPLFSAYLWLRRSPDKFLIPEKYLRLSDYVMPVWQILKGGWVLRGDHNVLDYCVTPLIKRERRANFSAAGWMRFLLYIPFLKRWTREGGHCDILVDMFENMPCERTLVRAIRQYSCEALTIGYQHATIMDELIGYRVTADEWASRVFPDRIVTNGVANREILANEGFPKGALIEGPAFRYNYLFNQNGSESGVARPADKKKVILTVLLPMDIPAAVELLLGVVRIADKVTAAGLRVELKNHPMSPEDRLMRAAGLSQLPSGWDWTKEGMRDQLDKTVIAIGMGTAALLDAAAAGVPVICLGRELGFSYNPLECLGSKYASCRTVGSAMFPQRFAEVAGDVSGDEGRQLKQLSSDIILGLGRLDHKNFLSFIRE